MAVEYLGTGNDDGVQLGRSATDKVGLYGVTPVAQRTSTALASSLISASSYATIASNLGPIVYEIANALIALGVVKTA